MTHASSSRLRAATIEDIGALVPLWALLFDEESTHSGQPWRGHARRWFADVVTDPQRACFPVIVVGNAIVATAIGTLELGVPNPYCPRGRTVRLANIVTLAEHRGQGYGTRLVKHVIAWAETIRADRVDLSATAQGQRIYERAGFVLTSSPRMKLPLSGRRRAQSGPGQGKGPRL